MKITDEIRKKVENYLEIEMEPGIMCSDEFYSFYYRCMKEDMHPYDADRYAILNTMFNYDIGMENARAIDAWMYDNDQDIFDLNPTMLKHRSLVALAAAEMDLKLDFSNWIRKNYEEYKFFE